MDCSPPSFSVPGIFQARMLEQVVISSPRGSSPSRGWTCLFCVSCIDRQILYHRATWEAPVLPSKSLCAWMHNEVKETRKLEFQSKESFLQGHARMSGLFSNNQNSPKNFSRAVLKAMWGRGIPAYVITSWTILIHSWQLILRHQKVWELNVHDHQVVNFFPLVVVFSIWETPEIYMRYYYLNTSETSYRWGYGGRCLSWEVPIGSC